MKKGVIYKTSESDDFDNKEIELSSLYGRTKKVKVSCYGDFLYVRSDKNLEYTKNDIPYDVNQEFIELSKMYQMFKSIGVNNITEFKIVPALGPFVDVKESDDYNLKSVFEKTIYPIKSVQCKIEQNNAHFDFHNGYSVKYNIGFPVRENIKSIV
jgi:hypothetical protein